LGGDVEAAILAQTRVHVVHKALALMERSDLSRLEKTETDCAYTSTSLESRLSSVLRTMEFYIIIPTTFSAITCFD